MFDYNSWFMTKLPPLCLCRRSSRTSFIGHEHGFFKCDCQVRGYKHKDNSSTEQRDAADEVQRKKNSFGNTKEEDHHEKKVLHKIKSEV